MKRPLVQRCPIEDLDILGRQVEAAGQKPPQIAHLTVWTQRLRKHHYATVLSLAQGLSVTGNKVGVESAGHRFSRFRCSLEPYSCLGCEDAHNSMSRYRPPSQPGSKYITPAGQQRLQEELDQLWRVERPQVTATVSAAAAQGDRSENAEYTYGKKRLREIDSRVRHLRSRLDGMVVVRDAPTDRKRVYFGAWVDLEDDAGERSRYRIVGPDEFDMVPQYISMDAPLARALLGKPLDTEVALPIAGQERRYLIVAISYN
jgi:transcription elongation factor GreB